MNFIENKHLPGLLMSCSGLLHVTVRQSTGLDFWRVAYKQ